MPPEHPGPSGRRSPGDAAVFRGRGKVRRRKGRGTYQGLERGKFNDQLASILQERHRHKYLDLEHNSESLGQEIVSNEHHIRTLWL